MKKLKLKFIFLFIFIFVGCEKGNKYQGIVYPDRESLADALQIGSFDTLQECGIAAITILDRLQALERGDYECGKNCKKRSDAPNLLICEETKKANIPVGVVRAAYSREKISNALETLFIREIYHSYNPKYLTYPTMLRAWIARKAILFKIPISEKLALSVQEQSKFVENVVCLGIVSDTVVPTIKMSPTKFEVYFNGLTKEKGIRLKLSN